MSRDYPPIYDAAARRAKADGIELTILQGGFYLADGEEAHYLTVLANFQPCAQPFSALPMVTAHMIDVLEHCQTVPLEGARESLRAALDAYPPSTVNLVVQLSEPGGRGVAATQVDECLEVLAGGTRHRRGIVIAVTPDCQAWKDLQCVDGFVQADGPAVDRDAADTLKALAAMMAPNALVETDEDDLRQVLGSAEQPSRLARAVWDPANAILGFKSPADRDVAAMATRAYVAPLGFDMNSMTAFKVICEEWKRVSPEASFLLSLTGGYYEMDPALLWAHAPVVALCA